MITLVLWLFYINEITGIWKKGVDPLPLIFHLRIIIHHFFFTAHVFCWLYCVCLHVRGTFVSCSNLLNVYLPIKKMNMFESISDFIFPCQQFHTNFYFTYHHEENFLIPIYSFEIQWYLKIDVLTGWNSWKCYEWWRKP